MIKHKLIDLISDSAKDLSVKGVASGAIYKNKHYEKCMEMEYVRAEILDAVLDAILTNDINRAVDIIEGKIYIPEKV